MRALSALSLSLSLALALSLALSRSLALSLPPSPTLSLSLTRSLSSHLFSLDTNADADPRFMSLMLNVHVDPVAVCGGCPSDGGATCTQRAHTTRNANTSPHASTRRIGQRTDARGCEGSRALRPSGAERTCPSLILEARLAHVHELGRDPRRLLRLRSSRLLGRHGHPP